MNFSLKAMHLCPALPHPLLCRLCGEQFPGILLKGVLLVGTGEDDEGEEHRLARELKDSGHSFNHSGRHLPDI